MKYFIRPGKNIVRFQVIAGRYKKLKRSYTALYCVLLGIISLLWIAIFLSWRSSNGSPQEQPTTLLLVLLGLIVFTLQSKWKITEIGICPGVIPLGFLAVVSTVLSYFIVYSIGYWSFVGWLDVSDISS